MFAFLLLFVHTVISTLKYGDNPYEILGIKRNAENNEIKKAYHRIARTYHPDVTKIDKKEAERIFIRATDAYELLINQTRRDAYDESGIVSEDLPTSQRSYDEYYDFDIENIFKQFYRNQNSYSYSYNDGKGHRHYSYSYSNSYGNSNSNSYKNNDDYNSETNYKTYKISSKFKSLFNKFKKK